MLTSSTFKLPSSTVSGRAADPPNKTTEIIAYLSEGLSQRSSAVRLSTRRPAFTMAAPLGLLRPSRSAPRPQVALLPPAGQLKRGRAGAAALVEDVLSADLGTPGVLSLAQGCMSPHFLGRFVEAAQRTPEGAAFVALAHRYVPDIAALLTGRTLMQLYHYYPCSMFGSPPSADQVAGIVASAIRHARGAPWAIALAAAARAFCTAASTSEQEAPSEMLRGAFYASLRIGGNAPAPVREELKPPGKSIAATVRT